MKQSNFYKSNIEQNEFPIALFILIFLIFVPAPTVISGILVWVVIFIILRQITKRVDIALVLSFAIIVVLFVFNRSKNFESGSYYFNKLTPVNYNIIKENYENKKKKVKSEEEEENSLDDIDDLLNSNEEEEEEETVEDTKTNDIKDRKTLKNAHKANKTLYNLNKTTKVLKETLESLEPTLSKGTDIMEKLKTFNLGQFL